MDRHEYFESLKALARQKREQYGVRTDGLGLAKVRQIFKEEGIKIDYWSHLPKKIKALYMLANGHSSVALQRTLPDEPKLFALLHELKHHYCDLQGLKDGVIFCGDFNQNEQLEVGAEVFAAEFIYPEQEFQDDVRSSGIVIWEAEEVVQFKKRCRAKVSYTYICKRLAQLGYISKDQFKGVQFTKLEEKIFGVPFYKRRRQRTA